MGCQLCKPSGRSKVNSKERKKAGKEPISTEHEDPIEEIPDSAKTPINKEKRTTKTLDEVVSFSYSLCFFGKKSSSSSKKNKNSVVSKIHSRSSRNKKKLLTLKEKEHSSQYSNHCGEEKEPQSDRDFDEFFDHIQRENFNKSLKEESFQSSSVQNNSFLHQREKDSLRKQLMKRMHNGSNETLRDKILFPRKRKESNISQGFSQNKLIKINNESYQNFSSKFSYKDKIMKPRHSILSQKNKCGMKICDIIGKRNDKERRKSKKKRKSKRKRIIVESEKGSDFPCEEGNCDNNMDISTVKKIYAQNKLSNSQKFEKKKAILAIQRSFHQSEKKVKVNAREKIIIKVQGPKKLRQESENIAQSKRFLPKAPQNKFKSMVTNEHNSKLLKYLGKSPQANSAEKRKPFQPPNSNSLKSSTLSLNVNTYLNPGLIEDVSPKSVFYTYNKKNSEKISMKSEKVPNHISVSQPPNLNKKDFGLPLIKLEEVHPDKEMTPRNDPRSSRLINQNFSQFIKNSPRLVKQESYERRAIYNAHHLIENTHRSHSMGNQNSSPKEISNELRIPLPRRQRKSISDIQETKSRPVVVNKRQFMLFGGESSESISDSSSDMDFRFSAGVKGKLDSPARSNMPALQRLRGDQDSQCSQGESAFSRNVSIHYRNVGDVTTFFDDTPIIEGYKIVRQIGHGSFAKVYKVRSNDTREEFAIKIIDIKKVEMISKWNNQNFNIQSEIKIMERLDHKNLIKLHKVIKSKKKISLLMDLFKQGTLCSKTFWEARKRKLGLKKVVKKLYMYEVQDYFKQLCEGLNELHNHYNIAHRDIKPDNVLVSDDGILKISDFGISEEFEDSDETSKKIGTMAFHPPEVYNCEKFSAKACDIWALGCILYFMVYQKYPNKCKKAEELIAKIKNFKIEYEEDTDMDLLLLMEGLFEKDPEKRLKIKEVLEMTWLVKKIEKEQKTE